MTNQIRILAFYQEALCDVADWARGQGARDAALAGHGEAAYRELSAARRELPAESLRAFLAQLPQYADAFPHKRTLASHLEKYLSALFDPVPAL